MAICQEEGVYQKIIKILINFVCQLQLPYAQLKLDFLERAFMIKASKVIEVKTTSSFNEWTGNCELDMINFLNI